MFAFCCSVSVAYAQQHHSRFDSIQHIAEVTVWSHYNHKEVIPSQTLGGEQLEKLNLGKEDIAKVLETLEAYAKEKGIPTVVLKTMLLPYLVKLTADRKANGNQSIPAVAVAQYLIGVFEKNQAKTEEQINQVINTLKESLGL